MLDLAHVGRLRVAIEELPHRLAGVVTGLGEGFSHETIAGAVLRAMIAHPVRQLTRVLGPAIAATPYKAIPIRLVRFRSGQVRSNPLLQRKRRATARRSRRTLMEMPRKSAAELEVECLRLLAMESAHARR